MEFANDSPDDRKQRKGANIIIEVDYEDSKGDESIVKNSDKIQTEDGI